MIFTARQLEEMHRAQGRITLPYRARLTPLAQDWIRQKKIEVGYSDVEAPAAKSAVPIDSAHREQPHAPTLGRWLWWCDGPCGPAKAALMGASRELGFGATELAIDSRSIVDAVKSIAQQVSGGSAAGAMLLVGNGAQAMVFANRCPALRAVLGTCIEAVEQGVRLVGANVLVIEHPYKTLQQTKTLISRFVRPHRELDAQVRQQLSELSRCE